MKAPLPIRHDWTVHRQLASTAGFHDNRMENWDHVFRCLEWAKYKIETWTWTPVSLQSHSLEPLRYVGENFGCLMNTWLGMRLILGHNSVKIVPALVEYTPSFFSPFSRLAISNFGFILDSTCKKTAEKEKHRNMKKITRFDFSDTGTSLMLTSGVSVFLGSQRTSNPGHPRTAALTLVC